MIVGSESNEFVFRVCGEIHSLLKLRIMFRFNGKLTYVRGDRSGDRATADLLIGFFPPSISIAIQDEFYGTTHLLLNSRFNFQSRDAFVDLLARDSWETDWLDVLDGDMHLVMPAITGVSHALDVRIYASRWPAFVVIDFRQGADFCQIATRPRASLNSRWLRQDDYLSDSQAPRSHPLNSTIAKSADTVTHAPDVSASSHNVPPDESEPDGPIVIDFERKVSPLKN